MIEPLEQILMLRMDEVIHVGTLDPETRTSRASLEGPCLSVSLDPDAWSSIARTAGPEWLLTRPGALWLDACALSDDQLSLISEWAIEEGFLERCDIWRAWHYDGESDDWGFSRHNTKEEAGYEVEGDDTGQAPTDDGEPVDVEAGLRLTDAGMERLERWGDRLDGLDGAIILYAMDLADRNPDLCGIWWNEDDNPLSLSCPRGGILPSRIYEFEAFSADFGRKPAGSLGPGTGHPETSPEYGG